ncbi:hypothetical protein [Vulgatibacter sp.]|uniref:hypothetical protein n=1 Tax=Vulgatibacter sp. TaxID=1971226 RepID=UPI003566DE42
MTRGFAGLVMMALVACSTPEPEQAAPPPAHPQQALDALDARTPLPLLPVMALHQKQNMQEHLVAVHEVVGALARGDHAAAAAAAKRLGTSEEMTRQCNHMGAGAPGFTERALAFHRTADTVVEAANAGDTKATLAALDRTLATCTSCHATWRQQVVDEATFARLGTTPPHHGP